MLKWCIIIMIYLILFFIGGISYNIIEYLWRGYSHWTMTIDGGLCLIGIVFICTMTNVNFILKVLASAMLITSVEFISGIIINRILKLNVWDYSDMHYNILGQICLEYTFLWTLLCVPLVAVITLIINNLKL